MPLRTMYVCRYIENAADIIKWFEKQGVANLRPANKLHVTVAYSRKPVDWGAMGHDLFEDENRRIIIMPFNSARRIAPLGDEGAVVEHFHSDELAARHRHFLKQGASWDYESYQPHFTFTYDAGPVNIKRLQPWDGELILGPEQFEDIDSDAK